MRLLLTIILPLFLLAACVTDDVPRNEGVSVGNPLPDFAVTLDNGKTVTTASLHGKVAMIIFFSTTCPDCQIGLPKLETVYRYFKDIPGVEIFAVSREESPHAVEVFWKEYGLTIPFAEQADRKVYNLFASTGVPRVYIANKSGIIVAAFDDSYVADPSEIINMINSLI